MKTEAIVTRNDSSEMRASQWSVDVIGVGGTGAHQRIQHRCYCQNRVRGYQNIKNIDLTSNNVLYCFANFSSFKSSKSVDYGVVVLSP